MALLTGTAMASYLARVNLSIVGDPLMREQGLTQAELGRVFSAFLVGYAACQVPGGMLADRWGTRRVLAVCSVWWALATIGIALAGRGPEGPFWATMPAVSIVAGLLWLGVVPRGREPTA